MKRMVTLLLDHAWLELVVSLLLVFAILLLVQRLTHG